MNSLVLATVVVGFISLGFLLSALTAVGLLRTLQRLIGAVAFGGLSLLLAGLLVVLHMCRAFSGETLVARVTAVRFSPEEFELTYVPQGEPSAPARRVRLSGDQWAISGGIVKWHPWLTALGLRSYHKPMRLSGQFSDLKKQRAHVPTVYPLEPGADRFWKALYWAYPYLPFIEAVYGSSAFTYVEPNAVQRIYVTPSGYMIKQQRRP